MIKLLALLLLFTMPAYASSPADVVGAAHKATPGVMDLQNLNASLIFGLPGMLNAPESWIFTKSDRPIDDRTYALIHYAPLFNESKAIYEGVPTSIIAWGNQQPAPIGSV